MAIDTNRPIGKALQAYVNLFSNRWNHDCDVCWALLIAAVHFVVGVGVGALL